MSENFVAELLKLGNSVGVSVPTEVSVGSANARFGAATEFLAKVNKKLGPAPKSKKLKADKE